MAVVYQIVLTSGELLAAIPEETINTQATSLTLVGRGTTEYGERLWNNLVHILESFASSAQPQNPLTGQLWYDTQSGVVKVYDGAVFQGISQVSPGSITDDSIASNAAIALSKLALANTPGDIIVADASKIARYVPMTGDVGIDSSGQTTIAKDIQIALSGDVTASTTQSNLDSWTLNATIADSAITNSKIAASAVDSNKLDSDAVIAAKIADNAVTESKIINSGVTTDKLGNLAVTTAKLAASAVTSGKLDSNSVIAAKIANAALESRHFGASSVPSAAYQDLSVGSSALAANAVTEAKLANNAVTVDKIAHGGTAAADFVLTYDGANLIFRQFSGSSLDAFSVAADRLVQPFLTSDYESIIAALPFSSEVNTQDLANTQAINIDYGGLS